MRSQDPFHRVFNISDGLPSNEVHDIYIDSLNQIWFTTDRGVCIYDGYDVKTFTTSDGLSFNTNFKIIPDRSGRLWFTGYDGSLSYYENGKFYKYEYNDILKKALGTNWVYYLEVDDDGLFIFQENIKESQSIDSYIHLNDRGIIQNKVFKNNRLGFDNKFNLSISGRKLRENDLFIFDSHKLPVLDFVISPMFRLFVLNNNSYEVKRFQKKTGSNNSILFSQEGDEVFSLYETRYSIHDILIDLNNNILLGTSNGIVFFEKGDFKKLPRTIFKGITITKVVIDNEGNYWASTLNNGVFFIPSLEIVSKGFMQKEIVNIENLDHHLIIGDSKRNIYSIGKEADKAIFNLELGLHSIKKFHKCEKRIIISGEKYLLENNHSEIEVRNFPKAKGYDFGFIRRNGDVILGRTPIQVYRDGQLYFSSENEINSIYDINYTIKLVVEDLNDKLYFANLEGLFVSVNDEYTEIRQIRDRLNFLSTRIQDLKIDQYNNKWIASIGNGLLCLLDNEEVLKFDLEKGISSDIVQAIEFENDSTIWIGTNKGLDRLTVRYNKGKPQIVSTINYNNTDGLTSNFILALKIWKDRLWIGTSNGLLSLDTDYNPTSESVPEMKILSAIIEPDSLVIRSNGIYEHDQNNLFIRYNGISYRKPKKNFYSYTLQKDKEEERWINTDQRELRIDNLPHGDYTFKVKAQNKYKEWSSTEELRFCIKKHFSQTWWFRILALLLFFYLIYFLYQRRLEKELEKQQIKRTVQAAKLQTEIAELTTFRNQFNPHFIFNLLNSIQNSIFKDDAKQANFYLSSFGNLMRKSLNLMSQKYVTLHEEIQFLKAYLDLEFLRFPEKFKYRFEIDEEIIEEIILIPPLLFQPAIENVLKHAFNEIDNGQLIIFIKKVKTQEAINIKVADNGSGINVDRKTERDSFGLKIIEDRIKLLKIEFPHIDSYFKIHSNRNSLGTIAEFQIPLINLKQRKR